MSDDFDDKSGDPQPLPPTQPLPPVISTSAPTSQMLSPPSAAPAGELTITPATADTVSWLPFDADGNSPFDPLTTAVMPTAPEPAPSSQESRPPGALMPLFVGARLEASQQFAEVQGVTFVRRDVPPLNRTQPSGLIVHQYPNQGVALYDGSVLAVDVVKRKTWWQQYAMTVVLLVAVAALMAAAVFAFTTDTDASANDAEVAALEEQIATLTETLESAEAVTSGVVDDLDAQLRSLQEQYDVVVAGYDTKIAELDSTIETLNSTVDDLTATNADLTAANTELTASMTTMADDLAAARQDAAAEKERADALQEQLDNLEALLDLAASEIVPMPNFVGQQRVRVEQFASTNQIDLKVVLVPTPSSAVGTVLKQGPAEGTSMTSGSAAWVEVASAP